MDDLEAASDFSNYITNNFDTMTELFSDSFNVLESAMDGEGVQERFRSTIQELSQLTINFTKTNAASAKIIAQNLAAVGEKSASYYEGVLQGFFGSAEELANEAMNNAEFAEVLVQNTAAQSQQATADMASGISAIISGIAAMIGGFQATITEEVKQKGQVEVGQTVFTDGDGKQHPLPVMAPTFTLGISGSTEGGGGSSEAGAPKKTYLDENTGEYMTNVYSYRDDPLIGNIPITTTRKATGQEIISYGSDKLAKSLQKLFGQGAPSMTQYAPAGAGGAYSPSSGGSGGGGGGGGGGKEGKVKEADKGS